MLDDHTYFFGPGVRAALSSDGERCLLEIAVEREYHPDANCVKVEVLYQARASNGLAIGAPATLHRAELPLSTLPDRSLAWARDWLPHGLSPQTARNCHFRVVPDMMRITTEENSQPDNDGADFQE